MKVISNLPGMAPIAVTTGDDTPAAGTTSPATSGAHHHHHHHATSTNNTSRRRGRGAHDPAHTPDAHELLEELHQLAQHHPSTHRRKTQRRGAAASTDPESPQEMDSSDEDEALRWEAIEAQEQALERLIVQVSARDSGNERDQKDRERDNRREASLRAMSHAAEQLASPSQTSAKPPTEPARVLPTSPTFGRTLKLSPSELGRTTHAAAVDAFARPATQEEISTLAAKALLALGNRYRASRHTSTPGDALKEATRIIAHALAMPVADGPASRRYATLRAVRHALVEAIRQVPSGSKTPGHDGQDSFLLLLPLMMLGLAAPMRASQRGIRQARFQAATRERLPAAEGLRK